MRKHRNRWRQDYVSKRYYGCDRCLREICSGELYTRDAQLNWPNDPAVVVQRYCQCA